MQKKFNVDITVVDYEDEGIFVECVQGHLDAISTVLRSAGLTLGSARIAIEGTENLQNLLELPVESGTFDDVKLAISTSLKNAGVAVTEENTVGPGEKRVLFFFENISLFGN